MMLNYRWTIIAGTYFLAVLAVDLLSSPHQNFTGLLTLIPVLLALEWGPTIVLLGTLPLVVIAATDVLGDAETTTEAVIVRTVGISVGIAIGTYIAAYRRRRSVTLKRSRAATEAAREAILPAVPGSVRGFGFSCAYRSAADESLIGGDFYKVLDTDFGVRMLLGDVQGKGLGAISMTAAVLGCFREWAPETASLKSLVARLDARVAEQAGDGDFVTAVVATLSEDAVLEVANCGHPSPLHLTQSGPRGGIIPERRTTPLGVAPDPEITSLQLTPGDRVLFYTDGLIESRDASGAWIQFDEALIGTVATDPFDGALDDLVSRVEARVGVLRDDLALLLFEVRREPRTGPHDPRRRPSQRPQ